MLNIVLFGPPGAGKGTQAQKLVDKYELVHLSTGEVFRTNLKEETELGLLARSYMDAGQLVPDDVTIKMVEKEINKYPYVKGFIFDGFPRNQSQAEALDAILDSKNTAVSMMLALEVNEDELKKRLMQRGQDSGRPDDQNPEVIQKRIDVYNTETAPVKEYYSAHGKYYGVYGVGEIDDIYDAICNVIDANSEPKTTTYPSQEKIENDTVESDWDEPVAVETPTIKKVTVKKTDTNPVVVKVTKPAVKKKAARPAAKKKVAKKKPAAKKIASKKAVKKKVVKKKAAKKVTQKKVAKKVNKKKVTPKKVNKRVAKKVNKKKTTPKKVSKKKVAKKQVKKIAKPKAKKVVKKVSKKKKK